MIESSPTKLLKGWKQKRWTTSAVFLSELKEKVKERKSMREMSFYILCSHVGVSPGIALEDEEIVEALKNREDEKVNKLLRTKF